MTERAHKERGPDRRRQPRGGRRPTDVEGYAPLVFVIDPRPSGRDACEAILAKLRFAVDYVEHATLGRDLRLIALTRRILVFGR